MEGPKKEIKFYKYKNKTERADIDELKSLIVNKAKLRKLSEYLFNQEKKVVNAC